MPRFFTHIDNGLGLQRDDVGGEFASSALAIGEAAKMAGEILRDDVRDRLGELRVVVNVEDEGGVPIAAITLSLSLSTPI